MFIKFDSQCMTKLIVDLKNDFFCLFVFSSYFFFLLFRYDVRSRCRRYMCMSVVVLSTKRKSEAGLLQTEKCMHSIYVNHD